MITTKQDYTELFKNVLELIHKSQISSLFSYEVFNSFPNNLGNSIREDLNNEIAYSLTERQLFIEWKNKEERKEILGERTRSVLNGIHFSYPFYEIQKIANKKSQRPKAIAGIGNRELMIYDIDFESIISEKQLVYLVGLLEGFILDSVRVIYFTKEEHIENHEIEPPLDELRNSENFESLKTERIIQITERKWASGSFTTRINKLKNKFDIELGFDPKLEAVLDEANLLRNCILHNGAKVSKDYYESIGLSKGMNIGDDIHTSKYFNEALYYLSIDLIKKLFCIVEFTSFYDNPESSVMIDVYNHSYFKDVMLNHDNWIYKRMTENEIY